MTQISLPFATAASCRACVGGPGSAGQVLVGLPGRTPEGPGPHAGRQQFVPEAPAVSGLDRERLAEEGLDPALAMAQFTRCVREVSGDAQPANLMAWPGPGSPR